MNLQEVYNLLNFYINKYTNSYFTPAELDSAMDGGQMALFRDYQSKYATSQRIKDALSPFRSSYTFDFPDTLLGLVVIPSNTNYMNLLDLEITYAISARSIVKQVPVAMINEDVRATRLDSQVDPVTAQTPIGEMVGLRTIQLYPKVQYRGTVTFLRRPIAPFFAYTIISGRIPVYDANTSIQLEWQQSQLNEVILKTLQILSINLSDAEIAGFAEAKTQSNWLNQNTQ